MKLLLALSSMLFVLAPFKSGDQGTDLGLPELHHIKKITLSPSYGCRSTEEFGRGYDETALFLSEYSKQRNSPDLLFNGACGADDTFDVSTAGDDMSLISDLGAVPVEEITAAKAFNLKQVNSMNLYSKFARTARARTRHSYAVLINKSTIRGLFIIYVAAHVPNKSVALRYAVKEYQVMNVRGQSEGFNWSAKNTVPDTQK